MPEKSQQAIATTEVPSQLPHKPDALDVLNNSGPLIAILIALGTALGLWKKWRDSERGRAAKEALLEKRVDDTEAAQREVARRMNNLETQVNDHSVTIGRIETQIDSLVKSNERIEKNIDRIFDKLDNLSSSPNIKR